MARSSSTPVPATATHGAQPASHTAAAAESAAAWAASVGASDGRCPRSSRRRART